MATAVEGQVPTWVSEGAQTNPTTSTVLADTGTLQIGTYLVTIEYSATVASVPDFQWRNAENLANEKYQRFHLGATTPVVLTKHVRVTKDYQRFRWILSANITGEACASISYQRTG